ncbi:peptidase [uncultured Rothia sp.]|uniref:peptidase n=1 Tax=uncultured Rothia sp. TaxID=316088 RepID=UPI0025E3084D|nr:peptidase [uncultured Rothia sp.]
MTETRPVRTAARYGAVVALAGALITPGAALTGTTLAFADTPVATQQNAKATVTIYTEKWRDGKLVLRGTGFTSTAPGRGAVFAVKFLDALPDEAHQAINPLTKKGGNSPANFMATAKEDGTFEVEVSLPTPENTGLTAEQLKNKGWTVEGTSHRIQVLSGSLGGTDADGNTYDRRASVSQNITLSDPAPSPAPTAEPSATADPSATAEPTPAPSADSKTCAPADGSFTPRLTIENPKAVQGGKLHLTGDGWCNPDDKKASVIGLKIDDGKVSRNDATAVNDNRTIWAVVTPDENGHIDAWIDLPTRENAAFKNDEDAAKYASGEHTLRLLTGSLRDGDRSGTYGGTNSQGGVNTTFTIGEYAPVDAPQPVNASELTNGNGVQVSRNGSTVTVTVPNAEPGTWVYAATYLGNSPQTLYGSGWKRLDGNRSFSYETSVSMPAATYRVVVHNGNQGAQNAVLGFADMTVERAVTPRQEVSRDEQDATDQLVEELNENPATATTTAPVPMRNAGGRISTRATDVDASLAALSQSTSPIVNRVQAKAKVQDAQKALASNLQKTDGAAKKAVKAAAGSKNSQNTQGSQNSAAGTKAQGPVIEGTELTGLTKWLVNNANNLLLSVSGLVVLAAALLLRTSKK